MWSYGGFWRRTAASLVDLVALVVITGLAGAIVLDAVLIRVDPRGDDAFLLVAIDWLVLPWLYFSLLESSPLMVAGTFVLRTRNPVPLARPDVAPAPLGRLLEAPPAAAATALRAERIGAVLLP